MKLFAGIDIGSCTTKAVVIDDEAKVVGSHVCRSGIDYQKSAREALKNALGEKSWNSMLIVSTGYGRHTIDFASETKTEIACHARGANYMYGPTVHTVMDMGGQDLKVIRCDERGKVQSFLMNEKCAAGTGRGMEVIANLLKVPIKEIGDLSLDVKEEPPPVSNTCVLFAKTEVMGLLYEGMPLNEVLAAYSRAMADRVCAQVKEVGVEPEFVITGGIAKNKGVVERLERCLGVKCLKTDIDYQLAGAIGAALFAKTLYEKSKKK